MDSSDDAAQDSLRSRESNSEQASHRSKPQKNHDSSTPLDTLVETMESVHLLEKTADKAFQKTWFLKLIGLPVIALALKLDSGWTVLFLPFIAIMTSAIVAEILKGVFGSILKGWTGLVLALSLTHLVIGIGLYVVFAQSTTIALFYAALIIAFLVAFGIQLRQDRDAAATLGLSAVLIRELQELTDEPRHPDVETILQRAAKERSDLRQVIANSLDGDGAIDHVGIQREYDAGFADLLDRAHTLSTLKTQADQGSNAAQSQAAIASDIFSKVAESIHGLVVAVLGYAGTKDSAALVDLQSRTKDLRQAREAHRELDS
ncbi:MAG: hypothetical protein VYA30_16310 [Myxococcota bacterium]|nr:hypothetical protein [Myxococcota bacterium]